MRCGDSLVKRLPVLVPILLLGANTIRAHQDFYCVMDFENVKVKITTGFQYEEIKKIAIIGELARRLSESMGYRETVFLDFQHAYTGECVGDHFVSFDDGAEPETGGSEKSKPFLESPAIVIRQADNSFDVATTLKLVEYAIPNVAEIKRSQRRPTHAGEYRHWSVRSIAKERIQAVIAAPVSPAIEKVWCRAVLRPGTDPNAYSGISYRFQDGKFHVYCWNRRDGEKPLMSLTDVYDFREISDSKALVFDTNESFYCVSRHGKPCSERHVIKETHGHYQPYEVQSLGYDKVAICFSYFLPSPPGSKLNMMVKSRTLIYRPECDDLVQDLDDLLERR